MPTGVCPLNLDGELDFLGAIVTYHGTWDGASVRASGCTGDLVWVRGQNPTARTLYAHFLGRRGTPRVITMAPGFDQTVQDPQLRNQGFEDTTDIEGLTITASPTPPT